MAALTVTIVIDDTGTAASVQVTDGDDKIIGEANDLDGLGEAIAWLDAWNRASDYDGAIRRDYNDGRYYVRRADTGQVYGPFDGVDAAERYATDWLGLRHIDVDVQDGTEEWSR